MFGPTSQALEAGLAVAEAIQLNAETIQQREVEAADSSVIVAGVEIVRHGRQLAEHGLQFGARPHLFFGLISQTKHSFLLTLYGPLCEPFQRRAEKQQMILFP